MATKDISDQQVCLAVAQKITDGGFVDEILMQTTGQPYKVCVRALERALARDYIEFGVSLTTAWLTEKGKELIK